MKLKTKLTLGVGLLFVLIVLLSVIGSVYINKLKSDTETFPAESPLPPISAGLEAPKEKLSTSI